MTRPRCTWTRIGSLIGVMGCFDGVVSGGRPLDIAITASELSPLVGDSVEFFVEASGVALVILRLDYGDGARDSLSTEGAVAATLRRSHAYDDPGAYVAFASALDVSESGFTTIADSVQVDVLPR